MTPPTDEELDKMARDLCHTGELSMPYRCEIADAIKSIRAQLAKVQSEKEKLGREVNTARYGQPDFSWQLHKEALAEANARADRAEAALAAQIEVDARIAEEEGWVPGKPHLGITEREEGSRDCAERIAVAIRAQGDA